MKNSRIKYHFYKRLFDIFFSLIGLIIFTIPILVLGVIIKFSSKGPMIYWSDRLGMNDSLFSMAKIRTMKVGSPELSSNHLGEPDKYFISFGKFFRDSGLDELPQLYNILKGDMSFVGPRPVLMDDFETITLRNEKQINTIKPGLTGLAQINGRNEITIPEKVMYDEIYLQNMSFLLDIKIIFMTNYYLIRENILNKTAYKRKSILLPCIQIELTNVKTTSICSTINN